MSTSLEILQQQAKESIRISISQHAFHRARERLRWTKNTILRMANRALQIGLAPGDAAGPLKFSLLGKVSFEQSVCPFLYGENVYIFGYNQADQEVVLLTVYRADRKVLKALVDKTRNYGTTAYFGPN